MAFPTSPVSPDAALLMTAHVVTAFAGGGLGRMLVQGVARDLTKRGIKAIEAFGDAKTDDDPVTSDGCLAPADFFLSVGFKTVRPHPRYPRLRLELRTALSWKSDVEYALEKLLGSMSPESLLRPVAPGHPLDERRKRYLAHWCAGGHQRAQRGDVDRAGRYVVLDRVVHPLHGGDDRLHDPLAEQRVDQPCAIGGRGQVAHLHPYGRHPGQPQQLPGLRVGLAVAQPGPHDDLALHQAGQSLPDRRGDARLSEP